MFWTHSLPNYYCSLTNSPNALVLSIRFYVTPSIVCCHNFSLELGGWKCRLTWAWFFVYLFILEFFKQRVYSFNTVFIENYFNSFWRTGARCCGYLHRTTAWNNVSSSYSWVPMNAVDAWDFLFFYTKTNALYRYPNAIDVIGGLMTIM